MLLKATLVIYKSPIKTTVFCPEIFQFGSGELLIDAKLDFFYTYPQILDSMARSGILKEHLIKNNWVSTENGLICPEYLPLEAVAVLESSHPDLDKISVVDTIQCTICIPIYENNNLPSGFIPKRTGLRNST